MNNNIKQLMHDWLTADSETIKLKKDYYCESRDIFQARLSKMTGDLLNNISEGDAYIISAIAGEIGNNSFDHNLGNWPDVAGIFFAYNMLAHEIEIFLADRGQGILKTLKRVKPELKNDAEALQTAFTERISGRMPENRGNGLKFVKENIASQKMNLIFTSGNAQAELDDKMKITPIDKSIRGCSAILEYS